MTEAARDLASADVWAASLERSLERRRTPRRSSVPLAALRPPRDLSASDDVLDSLAFSRRRRDAAAQAPGIPAPAARGLSLAGLVAALAAPTLVVAGSGGGKAKASASTASRSRAD